MFAQRGALFFGELLKTRGLLPSRVEQALAELAIQGWVTADSFEGMRALLLPQEKRVPFAGSARRRRHKAVSSVEFAGRWSLLRDPNTISPVPGQAQAGHYTQSGAGVSPVSAGVSPASATAPGRDQAVETFARVLLRRYGVVFRAMLGGESLKVSWYELGRVYRRLESRGEIRGGHFVSGVGGEQFALPEAIGLLRSIRKTAPDGQTVTISGADPLNLTGILGPGRRVASTASNRVLLRAGVPVAALVAGEVENLEGGTATPGPNFDRALRIGSMPAALRPYYG
jgi:ATP-dependent Lhr-like helicase